MCRRSAHRRSAHYVSTTTRAFCARQQMTRWRAQDSREWRWQQPQCAELMPCSLDQTAPRVCLQLHLESMARPCDFTSARCKHAMQCFGVAHAWLPALSAPKHIAQLSSCSRASFQCTEPRADPSAPSSERGHEQQYSTASPDSLFGGSGP